MKPLNRKIQVQWKHTIIAFLCFAIIPFQNQTAYATSSATYSAVAFAESAANDGSITETATITLAGETFTGADGDDWSALVTGEPTGLTAVLIRSSSTTATLSFTGTANSHANADDNATIQVTFTNAEITGGDVTIVTGINKVAGDITIDFADPTATVVPSSSAITVVTIPQAGLILTTSATTVEWGNQTKLTLAGGSGTGKVTYSSTGTTFCAVDSNGNLTPVSVGTCTVTATKDGDGTYGSAQSNSITITAVDKAPAATTGGGSTASGSSMVVGKPVGGVATVKFTVADTYAGERVSVILATKNSAGRTIYKTLGSAKVGSTGAVTFKTKVKLPVGAVLQLKSAGTVIFSKSIK